MWCSRKRVFTRLILSFVELESFLGVRYSERGSDLRSEYLRRDCIRRDRKRRGFSLIEVMVVITILGMLATAVVIAMRGYTDRARRTKAISEIATYVKAIESFQAVQGRYPTNAEGLESLTKPMKGSASGFIKKISKDPWKHPYDYLCPGSNKSAFEIISYGADGKEGGIDENADITSENLENE